MLTDDQKRMLRRKAAALEKLAREKKERLRQEGKDGRFVVEEVYAWVLRKLAKEGDVFVVVVGDEGTGKSTLAFQLAWVLRQLILGRVLEKDNIVFNGPALVALGLDFENVQVLDTLVADEIVFGGYSKDGMGRDNKDVGRWMLLGRKRHLVTFVNFPRLRRLGDEFVERAHVVVDCREEPKGRVAVFHKRGPTKQWSKKQQSFPIWGRLPYKALVEDHPGWDLWVGVQEGNLEALSRFKTRMAVDDADEDEIEGEWLAQARPILAEFAVPLA